MASMHDSTSVNAILPGPYGYRQFCKLFEPSIVRRASSAGTMDIEELMKEVCRVFLWRFYLQDLSLGA